MQLELLESRQLLAGPEEEREDVDTNEMKESESSHGMCWCGWHVGMDVMKIAGGVSMVGFYTYHQYQSLSDRLILGTAGCAAMTTAVLTVLDTQMEHRDVSVLSSLATTLFWEGVGVGFAAGVVGLHKLVTRPGRLLAHNPAELA